MDNTNDIIQAGGTMDEATAAQALRDYIAQSKKSQEAVAKELDISGGALSAFLSGKYKTPHTVIPKVEQLMKLTEKRRASPKKPAFKMTSISQQVTDVISYCHIAGEVGVVYGDPGVGKTLACDNYKKNHPDSILMTIYAPLSITAVNELLAKELNIEWARARNMFVEIVESLKGSNKIVIIDEAQHLPASTINYLRSIVDACKNTVGMVFVGNDEIILRIANTQYQQVRSRMHGGGIEHVEAGQIERSDIEAVFESAQLNADAIEILHKISQIPWCGMRVAASVFVRTIIGFQLTDYAEITAAKLAKTAKDMKVAVIMNG